MGATSIAGPSPTTSGIAPTAVATIGTPAAIASTSMRPKPSDRDGAARTSIAAYSPGMSCSAGSSGSSGNSNHAARSRFAR